MTPTRPEIRTRSARTCHQESALTHQQSASQERKTDDLIAGTSFSESLGKTLIIWALSYISEMGSIAGVSGSGAGVSATSLLTPVGLGVGGIFVAGTLVLLLAYLDILDTSERDDRDVRIILLAGASPLSITFAAIVVFESIRIL